MAKTTTKLVKREELVVEQEWASDPYCRSFFPKIQSLACETFTFQWQTTRES